MPGQMFQSFSFLKKYLLYFIFYLFIFLADSYKILVPQGGIKPVPPHWERGVLTTGPPGKSQTFTFLKGKSKYKITSSSHFDSELRNSLF